MTLDELKQESARLDSRIIDLYKEIDKLDLEKIAIDRQIVSIEE